MKFNLSMFLILFSTISFATTIKTEEKGNSKKIYLDYNSDNKVDLIETYHKNNLVKKEQDLDFDGGFDEVIEYFPFKSETEPVETIKKSDRLTKVYRNEKLKKMISTTQVDTDGDGKYDKVITNSEPLEQKRDNPCQSLADTISSKVSSLFKTVDKQMTVLNNGYYLNEAGYKVHKSCLDNWGAKAFPEALSKAKNGGLQCLKTLAQKNTENNPRLPNGALNNLNNLNRLYSNTPVTITCAEVEKDWTGTMAHASSTPGQTIKSMGITHPYLSINSTHPAVALKPAQDELAELSRTIFHEQLHNLGIRHGEGIEYPYTCESCCLADKDQSADVTATSCKICAGQYDIKNKKDTTYLKDLVAWSEATYSNEKAAKAVNQYQLENPSSQWGIIMQARAMSGVFSPVGIEMKKLLAKKFKNFSDEDKISMEKSSLYENETQIKAVAANARSVAQANIDFYYDTDPRKALATLKKNKEALKAIVKNAKSGASDKEIYTNKTLFKDTTKILNDIFMLGYPDHQDKESADGAYYLMKDLGID